MAVSGIQSPGGLKVTDVTTGKISKSDPKQPGESTFSKALEALSESQLETDVNFRVAVAILDKLVETYKEVIRMAV